MFRQLKSRLLKRGSGGFTLVEVIVSTSLLGILLLGVTMFVSPIMSLIAEGEDNSRAQIVAETIESYISRTLRNADYIQVYDNALLTDVRPGSGETGYIAPSGSNLDGMYNIAKSPDKDLQCLAITRQYDEKHRVYKFMLTHETISSMGANLEAGGSHEVFDDCFYEGLFPVVEIEFLNAVTEEDKNASSPTVDADGNIIGTGPLCAAKITVTIYTDQDLSEKTFVGQGYVDFLQIKLFGEGEVYNTIDLTHTPDADADPTGSGMYIYYVMRKTRS